MPDITVYDGCDIIGGNKIYVEENGKGVFLDFGTNFSENERYYEEFLKAREGRGIHDLFHLGIIPKLNVYRRDLVPRDIDISRYPSLNSCAVLLSHAHLDHCGHIGLLREEIPIVASNASIAILKAMQDSGHPNLGSDVAYFSRKTPVGENCLRLESDRKCGYSGRDFFCTATPSPEMVGFMEYRPGQDGPRAKKLEPGELSQVENHELPFRVSSFPVDHSIFGATAFILEGDLSIAYTGDFRMHGKNGDQSKKFVKEAKNSSILIMEGTRAGRTSETVGLECNPDPNDGAGEDAEKSPTEETVFENCLEVVEESSKLVIADFSPRNFERLQSFCEVAGKTGRNLVVTAKDAYLLNSLKYAGLDLGLKDILVYNELVDKSRRKWESEFVSETHDYANHDEIASSPEQYLLCFSLLDLKHLLDIKPGGGDYIYSSCEAFSEEMVIDFQKIWNWTKHFGFDVHGFSMEMEKGNLKPKFNNDYHVSGHASKEDLLWTVDHVDPDFIIPVHTTGNRWFTDNFDNVKIMEKGIGYGF